MLDFEIDKWAEIFTDEVEQLPKALDKLVERIREGYGEQLRPRECELKVNGRNLLLMSGGGHQIILRALALEPLTETDQMQYVMVPAGEKRIVVVMDGLFPVAIIREEELDNWILDVFNDLSTAVQGNAARQMRSGAEEEK